MAKITINPNIPGGGLAPNVHPMKGIAYGTIYGHKVPALMEHIFEHGTNVSYEDKREEIKQAIRSALNDAQRETGDMLDKIRERVCGDMRIALKEYVEECDEDIITEGVTCVVEFDNEEQLIDAYMETWECDEPTYRLEEDGFIYEMSYLGGAPLIFVIDAPIVTFASRCSPCVPNAGDLSSPSGFERDESSTVWYPLGGICCFAIALGWFDDKIPYKTRKIDDDGNVTGDWE